METVLSFFARMKEFLSVPIFSVGDVQFTLWTFLYILVLLFLLFYVSARIRDWLVRGMLVRSTLDLGVRQATGAIVRYLILVIGFLIILQTAGIDLTTLHVLAGAVGIGVGFGLQNIANNFISGLIILFERPIKVGDRIEVDDVEGDVMEISARSTTVVTNDNIAIIVPNSKFISENVVNWSFTDHKVRFKIPVSVAYGTDVRAVERLLLDVAHEDPDVHEDPQPVVRFMEFGDSGVRIELRVWSTSLMQKKGTLVSKLNFAIYEKFKQNGIEIPYPKRDIQVRGGTLEVKTSTSSS